MVPSGANAFPAEFPRGAGPRPFRPLSCANLFLLTSTSAQLLPTLHQEIMDASQLGRTSLSRSSEEDPAQGLPPLRPRNDQRVEAQAAAIAVDREDQLKHQKKEISPGPFVLGIVETEPQ